MKQYSLRSNIALSKENVNQLLEGLTEKCFRKSNMVYLYKVIKLNNGALYPIYTTHCCTDYFAINDSQGFPTKCSCQLATWLINLRKRIIG